MSPGCFPVCGCVVDLLTRSASWAHFCAQTLQPCCAHPPIACQAPPTPTPHPTPAERTVALLVFEDGRSSPLADLMDVAQRQKTASELNAAILASQSQVTGEGGRRGTGGRG